VRKKLFGGGGGRGKRPEGVGHVPNEGGEEEKMKLEKKDGT